MARALVTGATGTVGRALCAALRAAGHDVQPWNRSEVHPLDADAGRRFIEAVQPDVIYHLAAASAPTGVPDEGRRVTVEWTQNLARRAAERGAGFVFTSTVMVFSDRAEGPFRPDTAPDAAEGYGAEKRAAERAVLEAHPAAHVVRLGWQIGGREGGNHMVAWLDAEQERNGRIEASTRWLPACAFLDDTAAMLTDLPLLPPGLYHASSNTRWTFFEIVSALNALHGHPWTVVPTEAFVQDQRLLDPRLTMPPLSDRLPALPTG